MAAGPGCALGLGSEAVPRPGGMFGPGHVSGRQPWPRLSPRASAAAGREHLPAPLRGHTQPSELPAGSPSCPGHSDGRWKCPLNRREGARLAVDKTKAVHALTTRNNPAHLSSPNTHPVRLLERGLGFTAGLPWEHSTPGAMDRCRVGTQPGKPGRKGLVWGRLPRSLAWVLSSFSYVGPTDRK